MDIITQTVRALGINATYLGYRYLIDAVEIVIEDEDTLLSVCSKLYPAVAERHHTTPDNVERNIRTAVNACWERGNRSILEKLFPYPIVAKPSSGELIDAIAEYCRRAAKQAQSVANGDAK
ncbi:sporulation initiation factor Spo0A C-terminal domain-containing protein [Roseburia hominis]